MQKGLADQSNHPLLTRARRVKTTLLATVALAAALPLGATRAASTPQSGLEGIPRLSHIFTIVLENESYAATWGSGSPATYLNSLRSQGELLTQYYGVGHLSNDNYVSMTSGQQPTPPTESDCTNWYACVQADSSSAYGGGVSIGDQLDRAGLTWKGYMEDMPAPCTHASTTAATDPYGGNSTSGPGYNYADRHNPFIYYGPIVNNAARCAAHDVPYTQLASDFARGSVPTYAFIVPNTCNDGHDSPCANGQPGGLPTADAWLKQNVPQILSYVKNHNGLLVITFDEAANTDTSGCCGGGVAGSQGSGGRVGLLAISPKVPAGVENSTPYDHASLLRTTEDAFGIAEHLNNASSVNEHAMTDVFKAR